METIFNQTSNFPANTKDLRGVEASLFERLKKRLRFVKSRHGLTTEHRSRNNEGKYLFSPVRHDIDNQRKERRRSNATQPRTAQDTKSTFGGAVTCDSPSDRGRVAASGSLCRARPR